MNNAVVNVGDRLPDLVLPAITRTTLALFAGASGDHNPMHIDIDVARSAGMDDVFAHGMLSMAYCARLLTDFQPQRRLREWDVKFVAITPVNATPTCRGAVVEVGTDWFRVEFSVSLADGTETIRGDATFENVGAAP